MYLTVRRVGRMLLLANCVAKRAILPRQFLCPGTKVGLIAGLLSCWLGLVLWDHR